MGRNVPRPAWFAIAGLLFACGQPDVGAPVYLGDAARTHFAGAAQITKKNVASLTMAWTYDTGDFGSGVSTMQTSPLVVDGVLYGLTPTLNAFALNAADGAELWRYESQTAPGVQRGLMWLESDSGNRLLYTAGDWLIALDPTSGRGIDGFGEGGRLDLAALLDVDRVAAPVPGVVAEGLVILGLATDDGGAVVAIEATTGQLRWRYDPVAGGRGGAADVGIAYDSKRGLVFVPTGPPSPPYTGASRPGDNLYADTLLALDAKTGELEWHHQVVRHGLWGRELGAPPTLVQIEGNDGPVDAVALATRSGDLYVFDRESGLPLYGTSEVSVPSSTVPGEAAAETQRVSDVTFTSAPFSVTNRSESAAASVALALGDARRSRFAPPGTDGSVLFPGVDAGVGWGGLAYGVDGRKLLFNVQETASILRLLEVPAGFNDQDEYLRHCSRCHGVERKGIEGDRPDRYGAGGPSLVGVGGRLSENEIFSTIENGRGSMPAFPEVGELSRQAIVRYLIADPKGLNPAPRAERAAYVPARLRAVVDEDGLPGNASPWGSLLALDLDTGRIDWRAPLGNYLTEPTLGLGSANAGGPLLTGSGLLFIGATPDMKLSAYDVADGTLLWQADLDAAGYATPITYRVDGKQYVVIAAGGGLLGPPSGSTYAAFSLPD